MSYGDDGFSNYCRSCGYEHYPNDPRCVEEIRRNREYDEYVVKHGKRPPAKKNCTK